MGEAVKRYKVIFPSEHGSWSMTLVPFLIGVGTGAVATVGPFAALGAGLCLLAVLAIFLARQPVSLWLRIWRGRGRRSDLSTARFWTLALLAMAALAGAGLLALGRWPVLWLAAPAAGVLGLTLALTIWRGPRQLSTELIGVIGLALTAPAAYVSVAGRFDATAWLVWAITAGHNAISVLYVRLRIDDRHGRATGRQATWVVTAHTVSLLAVVGAAAAGWLPWLIALPVGLLLVRALVVARRRPSIADVRHFGFTEMGLGLAFAAIVVAAFLLAG